MIRAMDFGAGQKLWWDPHLDVDRTRLRGLSDSEKFAAQLEAAMAVSDVVTESPTVGSSGAEPDLIRKIVEGSPHDLYTISARAVKNACGRKSPADEEAAEIIRRIAEENPDALKLWSFVEADDKLQRKHTSVRPYDKRGYKDVQVDDWMSSLAPYDDLPDNLKDLFWNGLKRTPGYRKPLVLPFAMAFDEEGADSRSGYEHIIGLYAHGYPSFYRRATVNLMQKVAKIRNDVTKMADVTDGQRKEAWKETRRAIRQLYHLSKSSGQD